MNCRHRPEMRTLRRLVLTVVAAALVVEAGPRVSAHPDHATPGATSSNGVPGPTGKVVYRYSYGPMSGTSTLTWAENGKRFRQEMNLGGSLMPGSQTSIQTWVIGDGKHTFTWIPIYPKTVYRSPLPKLGAKGSSAAFEHGGGGGALPGFGAVPGSGTVLGKATLLGKVCEVRKLGQATIWSWKGLALKMVATITSGPEMSMVATEVESPYPAPPGLFRIPPGYKVVDGHPPMPKLGGAGGGGLQAPVRKGTQ